MSRQIIIRESWELYSTEKAESARMQIEMETWDGL